MFKEINIKITIQKISRYLYILTAIIILASLFFTSSFLYKNFYLAITQSDTIIELQEKVVDETINIKKYEEVIKKIEEKTRTNNLGEINNPF